VGAYAGSSWGVFVIFPKKKKNQRRHISPSTNEAVCKANNYSDFENICHVELLVDGEHGRGHL